ncbi:amylo-alpha-1,6-glucosidase [uncultured Clostridium sp.]|uniref:amylo-alpha-1,6-glucosidase n=1 Tax=uncultured Clostridium sp. TaxID=59620 RepID=UPI00261799DE|nr:amylo-alpha-1,6-glucosidase [uncultured Clostridium sp.]
MRFGKSDFINYERGIEKEWMIANGRSAFAGSTIIGANSRKYHAVLIAALKSPDERYMILPKVEEKFISNKIEYPLTTTKYEDEVIEGFKNLQSFSYNGIPEYKYFINGTVIKKRVFLQKDKNTAILEYSIKGNKDGGEIKLAPYMAFRVPGEVSLPENLLFKKENIKDGFKLNPKIKEELGIKIIIENGRVSSKNESITKEAFYDVDKSTGDDYLDRYYVPGKLTIDVKPYEEKKAYLICTLEKENINSEKIVSSEEKRIRALRNTFKGDNRPIAKLLPIAADNFIVDRDSIDSKTILAGYPWFLDWGRDTMIALTGVGMCTGRLEDTKKILKSFSVYEKNGIIPNMFPDFGQEPLYNTVDASLWYVHAIYTYLLYKGQKEELKFVKEELYGTIKNIIKAYSNGTDFSIGMDTDYLINAGDGKDQVTWMDVRANGIVVTPRHGKPVEINALWYNALKIAALLGKEFEDKEYLEYENLAQKVKESFNKKFWNEKKECLYDVVNEEGNDGAIRPNQVYAISLPFTMLPKEKEEKVIEKIYNELYTSFGLRSLDREDEDYKGKYKGELTDRDMAYHQGTVWSFPLGAFLSGYYKVNNYSEEARVFVSEALSEMETHICDSCLGGIAEIFDGDAPYSPRGCYNQAWGVGEILRVYFECVREKIKELDRAHINIFN